MSKVIMVQGTMSGVGKSLLVAGLCRIFKQDGYRVAPFKSQNMALNSFITDEGLEMGRAQVMQAEAAGIKPLVCMNPILLKPTDSIGSQVIVNGEVIGQMSAREYFAYKKQLIPEIKKAFSKLEEIADIIVIEGAGSPAEINLKENDIVNMGMAEIADCNVLLAGDIDRGGVFAQLLGTLMLLNDDEKERVKGLIINKFRGDKTILDPGIEMLEEKGHVKVVGTVPYMDIKLEDEDSLSDRFDSRVRKAIDIAVVRFPRISNFTDFNVFEQYDNVSIRYVTSANDLEGADMVILPGSKNTIGDLKWMRQNGIEAMTKKMSEKVPVFGVCGGFQMLGKRIEDPDFVEEGGALLGMNLLAVTTVLKPEKTRVAKTCTVNKTGGIFDSLSNLTCEGYEIHMGETAEEPGACDNTSQNIDNDNRDASSDDSKNKAIYNNDNVYGTYIHGFFDKKEIADCIIEKLAEKKGLLLSDITSTNDGKNVMDYSSFKEKEYERMASILRENLDMEAIYAMLK